MENELMGLQEEHSQQEPIASRLHTEIFLSSVPITNPCNKLMIMTKATSSF